MGWFATREKAIKFSAERLKPCVNEPLWCINFRISFEARMAERLSSSRDKTFPFNYTNLFKRVITTMRIFYSAKILTVLIFSFVRHECFIRQDSVNWIVFVIYAVEIVCEFYVKYFLHEGGVKML